MRFELPRAVRGRAEAMGEAGRAWLEGLNTAVADLEARWSLRTGATLTGGSESLVLEAERADGRGAVLKLGLPGSARLATEARILELADGRGYARCYASCPETNAVLLERLGPPLATYRPAAEGSGAHDAMLCATLLEAWQPLAANPGLTTGAEKARWLAEFVESGWQRLGTPCSRDLVDRILARCAEREAAHDDARCVLVHGDPHAFNALLDPDADPAREQCRFVDPDGLFAEPEYDLGVIAREWSDAAYLADPVAEDARRCAHLAALTGLDAEAASSWGAIERVSTALVCLEIGEREAGERLLCAAAALDGA
jgi:streptomycin 6-kinase